MAGKKQVFVKSIEDLLREDLWYTLEILFILYEENSFAQIAQMSNLSIPTVRKLWGGVWKYPRFQTIQKLAAGVDVDLSVTSGGIVLNFNKEDNTLS